MMHFPTHRAPAFPPLAIASAVASALALYLAAGQARADEATLPAVTVTGARFASDPAFAPIGATVISADDIRRSGASDVNQAIRKIGGVYGRQSVDASPDFGLDLRGFGANSSQNLVVMLDGVRMSENELSGSVLSTIPIDLVERIEITRGGASVLFGEGATGGVIQIVTKRPAANQSRGSLAAGIGQFNARDLRASATQAWDGYAIDAAVGSLKTDNYRDHNAYDLTTFNVGGQWAHRSGRIGVRVERAASEAQFPGALTLAQFDANPRKSRNDLDFGEIESDRVSAFVEQRVGGVDLAAELSRRNKTVESNYYYPDLSRAVYDSRQTQFSPRLRYLAEVGGMLNEVVAGIDLTRWTRTTRAGFSQADAEQKSKAVYLRDELRFDPAHNGRISAGVRRETFDKDYAERISYAPFAESTSQSQNTWELQGSYDVAPQVNLYLKAGRSYRVANADENSYRSSDGALDIQTSRDLEAGISFGDSARSATARLFRHRLTNEIFFDPTLNGFGANTNLDPTEREGVEIDADAAIAADWRVRAHAQHVRARFTEGVNAGREMVLVPKNTVSARLTWAPNGGHSADIGVQWVASQRYGDDFSNTCAARVPSYHTVDARYARKLGAWEFAVSGLNLADKRYYSNAYACQAGIYPSDARQLKLSARYDF